MYEYMHNEFIGDWQIYFSYSPPLLSNLMGLIEVQDNHEKD